MNEKDRVDAVGRMQDYIEQNLNDPITLFELSRCAGYSPYHCTRIFKEQVGKTPFEYIRALRLSKAALSLRDEEKKIIDVALDYMFDSHEGFTRAFSKEFGITPHKYTKKPIPIYLFMPYSVRQQYRYKTKGEKSMKKKETPHTIFVQVVERPERKVILKRGVEAAEYFKYCEEVGCEIWGLLSSIKEALYEPIGMWLPKKFRPEGTSEYAQGVEVAMDYNGEVPKALK